MIPKFRFHHLTENEMYEVNGVRLIQKTVECFPKDYRFSFVTFEEDEGILMQSTGLKDKNGVDIYEGDVLHHKVQGTSVVYYPFRDNMASFGIRNIKNNLGTTLKDADKAGYEIIGNQFEHPHLLKE